MNNRLNKIERALLKIKNSDSELERIEKNHLKLQAEAIEKYFNGNENVEFPEVPEHMKKRSKAHSSVAWKEIDEFIEKLERVIQ